MSCGKRERMTLSLNTMEPKIASILPIHASTSKDYKYYNTALKMQCQPRGV